MITRLDHRFLLFIQRLRFGPLTVFFKYLTFTGSANFWLPFAAIINLCYYTGFEIFPEQKKFLNAMWGVLLAWAISRLIKRLANRDRPYKVVQYLNPVIEAPTCGSFPSSHSSTTMALATGLIMLSHPFAPYALAWALLVAFSRIYLGVHFLTDVVVGILIGISSSIILK